MMTTSYAGALFFLALLGYAFGLMLLWPKLKMGAALLSAFCGMLLVAYWGVIILQWMVPTAYVLLYGGLALFAAGMAALIGGWRGLRGRILSVAFFGYVGFCLYIIIRYAGVEITDHDSYSFWMRAVKELFTFDKSYFNAEANLSHSDYNPIFAALQYSLMRVWGWQDAYMLYVTAACVIVPMCAVTDLIEKKRYAAIGLILMVGLFFISGFDLGVTNANGPLAAFFFGALVVVCFREDGSFISLLPGMAAIAILPALKLYSGLMFALVLLGVWIFSLRKKDSPQRVTPRFILLACGLMLLMECSWSGFYNYQCRKADYEAKQAKQVYMGETPAQEALPSFRITDLVSGNPRNESLSHALNADTTRQVLSLIKQSVEIYLRSTVVYAWLFLLPVLVLLLLGKGAFRAQVKVALWAAVIAFGCYTLGMFAAYYVQAETAPSAAVYLRIVSMPFAWLAVFVCAKAAAIKQTPFLSNGLLAAFAVVIALGHPLPRIMPTEVVRDENQVYTNEYTSSLFHDELAGLLTDADKGARALLVDCTWDASQIRSKSGITHAYQYYGLPMRVTVDQYAYGEYDPLEWITKQNIDKSVTRDRNSLLILRMDDELYQDAFVQALEVDTDADMPWVFDVALEDGEWVYTLRNLEEE